MPKLSKRKLEALMDRLIAEGKKIGAGENENIALVAHAAAPLNGCIAYRGSGTQPVCRNMSAEDCHKLDVLLKEQDINFFAAPQSGPCEG